MNPDTFLDGPVLEWTGFQVAEWLQSVDLDEFIDVFAENNIDGEVLRELNHDLLKDMDIKSVGKRVAILKAITKLFNDRGMSTQNLTSVSERNSDRLTTFETSMREKDDVIYQLRDQLNDVKSSLTILREEMRRASEDSERSTIPFPSSPISKSAAKKTISKKDKKETKLTLPKVDANSNSFIRSNSTAKKLMSSLKGKSPKDDTQMKGVIFEDGKGMIRLVGDSLREFENYKTFVVGEVDTCEAILRLALRKYGLRESEWLQYALFVHVKGKERCLRYDEMPLKIKQQIVQNQKSVEPMFILRHLHQLSSAEKDAIGAKADNVTRASRSSSLGLTSQTFEHRSENSFPERAVVIYMYDAVLDDELTVSIGDQVTVLKRATGWWYCQNNERYGWAPSGCLDVLPPVAIEPIEPGEGTVLYDYEADGANELSIHKGDKVVVRSRHQHWLLAETAKERGWIPSCYVVVEKDGQTEQWRNAPMASSDKGFNSDGDVPVNLTDNDSSAELSDKGDAEDEEDDEEHGRSRSNTIDRQEQASNEVQRLSRVLDQVPTDIFSAASKDVSSEARLNVRKLLMEIDRDLQEMNAQTQADPLTTQSIRSRISNMVHELEVMEQQAQSRPTISVDANRLNAKVKVETAARVASIKETPSSSNEAQVAQVEEWDQVVSQTTSTVVATSEPATAEPATITEAAIAVDSNDAAAKEVSTVDESAASAERVLRSPPPTVPKPSFLKSTSSSNISQSSLPAVEPIFSRPPVPVPRSKSSENHSTLTKATSSEQLSSSQGNINVSDNNNRQGTLPPRKPSNGTVSTDHNAENELKRVMAAIAKRNIIE